MIHLTNQNKIKRDEIKNRGIYLMEIANKKLNTNCMYKLLFNKLIAKKTLLLYISASDEFKNINETELYFQAYENALEQCLKLDKFQSIKTINILMIYYVICNKNSIKIKDKYIEYFENYSLKILEKNKKFIKIANIYKLLGTNNKNELGIYFYEKSNLYYRKTRGTLFEIEENNRAIQNINNEIGKNIIWH